MQAHPSLPVVYQYSPHYAQAYIARPTAANEPLTHHPYDSPALRFPAKSPYFQPSATWYQPGNCKCAYKGCTFSASYKALEIHMMDRHLIYPSGWEKRPKKSDWDADPSLKGKLVTIQGTSLSLDKPEDLKTWLAERRKRWPTAARVEEKKRKMDEALARGQLSSGDSYSHRRKRQRTNNFDIERHGNKGNEQDLPDRGRVRSTDFGWSSRNQKAQVHPSEELKAPKSPVLAEQTDQDEGAPEVFTSKRPPEPIAGIDGNVSSVREREQHIPLYQPKRTVRHPKKEPHNPFASRPTLLRNLLLPDIRVTISNLSQAIRFLVDNDFLRDVEEIPGAAVEKKIEVIATQSLLQTVHEAPNTKS